MANNSDIAKLLEAILDQGERQTKYLEGLSVNDTRRTTKENSAAAKTARANKIAGRQLIASQGLSGVASSLQGGVAGGVLGAASSLMNTVVSDVNRPRNAANQAIRSGLDRADPFASGSAVVSRLNQQANEAYRVGQAGSMMDWSNPGGGFINWDRNQDIAVAKAKNLKERQRMEPGLRVIRGAKGMASQALGQIAELTGDVDESAMRDTFNFFAAQKVRRVKFEKRLENYAGRFEATVRGAKSSLPVMVFQ